MTKHAVIVVDPATMRTIVPRSLPHAGVVGAAKARGAASVPFDLILAEVDARDLDGGNRAAPTRRPMGQQDGSRS